MYISEATIQDKGKTDVVSIWYDRSRVCSYNALFSFCLGARGTGKTFNYKCWCISSSKPFIWVRRLEEDIKKLTKDDCREFVKDLYYEGILTPEDICKVEADCLYINGIPKFYFIPLSLSARYKSTSFADVDIIIFDEVFEGVGSKKYLKDEVVLFLDLYETVNRLRIDGRPEVRVFFLSNNVSFTNPYFVHWGITPFEGRFKTFVEGLIVVENYKNEAFAKKKKETKFGRLIAGTKYAKYSIDNEIWLDDNAFLEKRPKDSIPIVEIRYKEQYISVWNGKNGYIYVDGARSSGRKYSIKYECLDGELSLSLGKYPLKQLNELFYIGKIRFDNNITKSIMYTLLQTAGQS